jgi:hypothetical protein
MKRSLRATLVPKSRSDSAMNKVVAFPISPRPTKHCSLGNATNTLQPEHHIIMLSDNTSSSLPDEGAEYGTGGPEPLLTMDNTQHNEASLLIVCSSGPQTRSQPTARDENEAKIISSQTKQQRDDSTKSVAFVTDLMRKLGIPALTKSLSRGLQHQILREHPRALRTYESAHVDGAWIMGDASEDMISLTYAQRLRHLGILGGKEVRRQGLAFHRGKSAEDQNSAQSPYVSNVHVSVPSAPGVVILAPPHDHGSVLSGFRDPLMSNIRVSLAPSNSHNEMTLIKVTAPPSVHATSCACLPSCRSSRSLETSGGEWSQVQGSWV